MNRLDTNSTASILTVLLLFVILLAAPLTAESPVVTIATPSETWIEPNHSLSLQISPWPSPKEGRIAVLIGAVDTTDLFQKTDEGLRYRGDLLPLPRGESEISVYLVPPTGPWIEIARQPLQVLRAGGFESVSRRATLDLEIRSVYDPEVADPFDPPSTRADTMTKASGQFGFDFATARRGWSYAFQAGALGVSERNEALRFSSDGIDAPQLDLSSYLASVSRNDVRLEVGHLSVGDSRNLVSGFSSRGLSLSLPLGNRVVVRGAALNGSQIVGWDNLLGLSQSNHRVHTASVGVELLPRPGALQISGSWIDATVLPLSGFDQGNLSDREESSGWSTRLATSTPGGRFTLRGGFARSRFDNPADPFLAQDEDLVEVEKETRDAHFAELELGLLRSTLGRSEQPFTLDLSLKHQRIDPLYRSVGAFVASDLEENRADLRASLGQVSAQWGQVRSHDNLDRIPSVLETKTRRQSGSLFLPLAALKPREDGVERRWLPALSYIYGRTHQFSDRLPIHGGFSPGHLPDQVSLTHSVSMDWQGNLWRLNATLGTSDQDNRQPGREANDFTARSAGLNLGLTPHARVDLSLSLSEEEAENRAAAETDSTARTGLNLSWRPRDRQSIDIIGSRSRSENAPRSRESASSDFSLQWNWQFGRSGPQHGFTSQFHLLYSWQSFESRDLVFGFDDESDRWTVSAGLTLSFH